MTNNTGWMPTPKDIDRFWRRVVKGPEDHHCWFWTGAIADDGYGRFWVNVDGQPKVVRPHRFVFSIVTGRPLFQVAAGGDPATVLTSSDVVEHQTCDNPICVRFAGNELDHLMLSDQSANLTRMAQRGRGGGHWSAYRFRGNDRASLAARSRRLRDAVREGWNEERILSALAPEEAQQPPLW